MNYVRVIPRDFFNESKLLKCFGQLSIKIHDCQLPDGLSIEIEGNGEPFNIALLTEGSLIITNYATTINKQPVTFKTTYNSKAPYPLICEYEDGEYTVFADNGEFDEEFLELAKSIVPVMGSFDHNGDTI